MDIQTAAATLSAPLGASGTAGALESIAKEIQFATPTESAGPPPVSPTDAGVGSRLDLSV